MVTENMMRIISEQTKILFMNLEAILETLQESDLYNKNICDWPLGEQIYHLLHSMDQWFINPNRYKESILYSITKRDRANLTKDELIEYYQSTKSKITSYIENLNLDSLIEEPMDCDFSRLDLILGQYRHFMYHIGLIHGCLRRYTNGTSPAYFGLGPPIKPIS